MVYDKINFKHLKNNDNNTLILFLHGWGCDMKSFKFFEGFFSSKYSVLNCDLYGFGKSELSSSEFGVYDYAKNIFLFLKSLNYENVIIICHSFGFRIATILSTCFDIKIIKMIVTGGAGLKPRYNILVKLKILIYRLFVKKIKIKKHIGSEDYRNSSNNMKKVLVKVVNQHLDFLVKKIDCSTLLVWGKDDNATPLYMARKINKLIRKSKLKLINGSHFAFNENKFLFKELCYNFLFDNE